MLLNVETIYNDSKKISELKKLTKVTKHQENSWLPLAQYNSRTNTYTNAAINLQAITSYSYEQAVSYISNVISAYWFKLKEVGDQTKYHDIESAISKSEIASNIVSYSTTYALQHLDWQIVNGSYIPDYYVPLDPDDILGEPKPMTPPIFPLEEDEEIDIEETDE